MKKVPSCSESTLLALWRKVVRKEWGSSCAMCGANESGGELEIHHIVKRRCKLLKFDPQNGIPVHVGPCHEAANLAAPRLIPAKQYDYLQYWRGVSFKQYLVDEGITEDEWRKWIKESLTAALDRTLSNKWASGPADL